MRMFNKYKNKKIVIDNIEFASRKEAKRYTELKLFEKAGKIKNLTLQPKFELQERFKKNGKTYRAITYIADFMYFDMDKGKEIVEDCKGFKTEVYKIKKKLFEKKHIQYELIEV